MFIVREQNASPSAECPGIAPDASLSAECSVLTYEYSDASLKVQSVLYHTQNVQHSIECFLITKSDASLTAECPDSSRTPQLAQSVRFKDKQDASLKCRVSGILIKHLT